MIRNRSLLAIAFLVPLSHLPILAEPAVVRTDRVNVRSQPSRDGEVLTTLRKGDVIDVRSTVGEGWIRIGYPAKAPVWVYGPLVDVPGRQVKAKDANLRSGPGKNYSELGQLHKGDAIRVLRESDGWVQVEPPAGLSAFISSGLVRTGSDPAVVLEPTRTGGILPQETLVTGQPAGIVQNTAEARSKVTRIVQPTRETVVQAESLNSQSTITGKSVVGSSTVTVSDTQLRADALRNQQTVQGRAVVPAESVVSSRQIQETGAQVLPNPAPIQPAPVSSNPVPTAYVSTVSEGSQLLLRYSSTVRTVVRVGRVGLSLDPISPSYFDLKSVLPGEGTLGYLASEDGSMKFGGYRGKVVRVTADEYQTQAQPPRAVLLVRTLELEPGY